MVKFPVVSFIIELEPKMLSVYDGRTYLTTNGQTDWIIETASLFKTSKLVQKKKI